MATGPTITSILAKQSDLLQKIDSIDNNVVRINSSISELEEERQALRIERMRLSRSLWELDKTVVNLICGSSEELRRFAGVINSLVNYDHPQWGAGAVNKRYLDQLDQLGFTQSSSEG